ncbi:MAG: PAS domain-containing hybrid sensor histidine kinase/response regulator [bacterium]
MNLRYNIIYPTWAIYFIFQIIFTYYTIRNAKIMKGSAGRQIMAISAILFISASIIDAVDAIFLTNNELNYLSAFFVWIIALSTFIYGGYLVAQDIKTVYPFHLLELPFKHQGSIYNLIGITLLVFLGIPIYILDIIYSRFVLFSWTSVFLNLIWAVSFGNLMQASRLHFSAVQTIKEKPEIEMKSLELLKDDIFTINAYIDFINNFLQKTGPAMHTFRDLITDFFEDNPILFDNCEINQEGIIDVKPIIRSVDRLNEEDRIQEICIIFSAFISLLHDFYSALTSHKHAENILSSAYISIRQLYGDTPTFFFILRGLPDGVLEDEKIALLPRKELEANVQQRTRELEESRSYISNILKNMMDMLIVLDINGNIKTVNKATNALLEYEESELLGQSYHKIFFKDAFDDNWIADLISKGSIQNTEKIFISKYGKKITVLFSSSVMYDEYAEPQGLICVAQDITKLKNAERVLRESEEKYRLVVEKANEGIVIIKDGIFEYANPKALQISGYSFDEIRSKNFIELVYSDDRNVVLEKYQETISRKEFYQFPFRIISSDGRIKWVEINAIIINWKEQPAILVFMNDITEKRRIEEEILRMQKMESFGSMARSIAHDFNNFLTGIIGNITLAEMLVNPEDRIYKRLIKAEKAGERAKELTQQLLNLSKHDHPKLKIISLYDCLRDYVNLGIIGSNVKCNYDIPENLWAVEIDEGQISQVISNIVINAKDAMPNGGVIEVSAKNELLDEENPYALKPGPYIVISIKDHGIGISEDNLQRIFEPYFTTKPKGNGLGLAISFSIVKKYNGHIRVESRLGVGTTFYIYLPAISDKVAVKEEVQEAKPVNGKGRILVMDDEEIIRELTTEMLTSIGYEVVATEDGESTLKLYKESLDLGKAFDIVILDLTIPGGIGGKEVVQRLKEINPNVKAIVSSGYFNDSAMSDYELHGFKGFIAKPYNIKQISEILQKVSSG